MSFGEDEPTSAIDGDREVTTEQTIAIQDFLPDQGFDYPAYDFLHLVWEQATEQHIRCVAVGAGLHTEYRLKLGLRRPIAAKQVVDLSARPQATQKHQQRSKAHSRQRVNRKDGVTWIVDWAAESGEATQEVMDSNYEGVEERQLFLSVLIQRLSGRRGGLCG